MRRHGGWLGMDKKSLIGCVIATCASAGRASAATTVTGTVFADANRNGILDCGEKGIGGAVVSDGLQFVGADASGKYALATSARFVWVDVPAGYAPGVGFYYDLTTPPAGGIVDFPLQASATTAGASVTFAQLSDVHMNYDDMSAPSIVTAPDLERVLGDIAVDSLAPAFVIATGDLTQGSNASEFAMYETAVGALGLPVANVPGNHDWYDGGVNYHAYLGPDTYSFDAGPAHFVVVANWAATTTWAAGAASFIDAERAAGMIAKGQPVVVAMHAPPTDADVMTLAPHGVTDILSGHWHSSRVYQVAGVTSVNSPPAVFGGIDMTPSGYRIVTLSDSTGSPTVTTTFRPVPIEPTLHGAWPASGATLAPGTATIYAEVLGIVQAANVTATIDGAALGAATPVGGFTYALPSVDLSMPGQHSLVWTVAAKAGGKVLATADVSFTVGTPTPVTPVPGADWTAFHGGPAHTGMAADQLVPPLALAWAAPAGGYVNLASPVVKDGMVFQSTTDYDGGAQSGVTALDGVTGKQLWRYLTQSPAESTVAAAGDEILVTTQDGSLIALDEATGLERWKWHEMLSPAAMAMNPYATNDFVWLYAGPVVDGTSVFVGAEPEFDAVSLASGDQVWQVDTNYQWLTTYSTPATSNGVVVAAFGRTAGPDSLQAYSETTGAVLWPSSPFDDTGSEASPAVSDGTVYAASGDGHVYAVDLATGATRWKATLVNSGTVWNYDIVSTPTLGPDQIYEATATGVVQAFDRQTGAGPKWMFAQQGAGDINVSPFKSGTKAITSSPVLSGEVLYVAGNDGYLYALAAHDHNPGCPAGTPQVGGCLLWSYDLGAPTASSPAISGNYLYISTLAGMVYAFAGASSPVVPPGTLNPNGCACSVVHPAQSTLAGLALSLFATAALFAGLRARRRRARLTSHGRRRS